MIVCTDTLIPYINRIMMIISTDTLIINKQNNNNHLY